jgi:hypothetical protein
MGHGKEATNAIRPMRWVSLYRHLGIVAPSLSMNK